MSTFSLPWELKRAWAHTSGEHQVCADNVIKYLEIRKSPLHVQLGSTVPARDSSPSERSTGRSSQVQFCSWRHWFHPRQQGGEALLPTHSRAVLQRVVGQAGQTWQPGQWGCLFSLKGQQKDGVFVSKQLTPLRWAPIVLTFSGKLSERHRRSSPAKK